MRNRFGTLAGLVGAGLVVAQIASAEALVDFASVTSDLSTNKATYIGIGVGVLAIVIGVKLARRLVAASGVGK